MHNLDTVYIPKLQGTFACTYIHVLLILRNDKYQCLSLHTCRYVYLVSLMYVSGTGEIRSINLIFLPVLYFSYLENHQNLTSINFGKQS